MALYEFDQIVLGKFLKCFLGLRILDLLARARRSLGRLGRFGGLGVLDLFELIFEFLDILQLGFDFLEFVADILDAVHGAKIF